MATTPLGRAVAQRGRDWLNAPPIPNDDLIDLSSESISGTTPDSVREATIEALQQHLGDHYTRRPGIAPLCKAVATHLAAFGIEVDANNEVVITGGLQEARFVAVRTLTVNKQVFVPQPAPLPYYTAAAFFAGAEVHLFEPLTDLPQASGGVLILSNPNPATGQLYPNDTLVRIAAWAENSDLTVIADETIAPLARPDIAFTPFAALPGMAARTLTLGSFAATPGLSAWQVGWFAGAKPLATAVRDLKQAMTICSPAASQYAALAGSKHAVSAAVQHVERQEALMALLDQYAIPYHKPHTIAYVVADVAALGGADIVSAMCAEHGVRVANGSAFGSPATIRITVNATRFGEALDSLNAAFAALTSKEIPS